jgi:hypothetical protein
MTRMKLKVPLWVSLVFESLNITSGHYAIRKWLIEEGYADPQMSRQVIRKLWSWDNEVTKNHIWVRTWAEDEQSPEDVGTNND